MEQPTRILMLYYLLKNSVTEQNYEDFGIIVEFLAHLSESRKFCDAFVGVIEELSLFDNPKHKPETTDGIDEFRSLFHILNCAFFNDKMSKLSKVKFLKFLCDLSWRGRSVYLTHFEQHKKIIFRKLIAAIDCEETANRLSASDELSLNLYENTTTNINLLGFLESTNFGEVLE